MDRIIKAIIFFLLSQNIFSQNMVIKLPDNLPEGKEYYQLDVNDGITIYFPLPIERKGFLKDNFTEPVEKAKFYIRLSYNYDGKIYSHIVGYRGERPELKKLDKAELNSEINKEFSCLMVDETTAMLLADIKKIASGTSLINTISSYFFIDDELIIIKSGEYGNKSGNIEEAQLNNVKENLNFISKNYIVRGIPLEENFNNSGTIFIQDENWQTANDILTFRNGKEGNSYMKSLKPFYTDFTLSVKARLDNHKDGDYGLLFGDSNSGFSIFTIDVFGQVSLSKMVGDEWMDIAPLKFSHVLGGGFKELKVTVLNNTIKCFVNDKLVFDTTDNSYSGGKVGIFSDGNVEISLDDFKIGPPDFSTEKVTAIKKEEENNSNFANKITDILAVNENFKSETTDFQLNDSWILEDGALYHTSDKEDCMHWNRVTNSYNDCTVSVKTKWAGNETNSSFGLRYGDRHCFFIAQDGHYKMSRWTGSGWVNLVPWQETDLVSDDYNTLTVTCSGKNIRAYLNNVLVIDINDDSYSGGYVGLVCSCDVEAYFDDFVVIVPSTNTDLKKNNNSFTEMDGNNNIILRDNFDGNTSVLKLNQYWKLDKNALAFSNGVPRKTYWTYTENNYTDFTCSVNALWTGKKNYLGYGLAFGINGNMTYAFDITQHGYYEISYWDGAKWDDIVPYQKSDLIKFGFNNLKISIKNNRVKCYINNAQVFDAQIDNYSGGRIGVFCCGEVEASFDDFIVKVP